MNYCIKLATIKQPHFDYIVNKKIHGRSRVNKYDKKIQKMAKHHARVPEILYHPIIGERDKMLFQ